MEWRLFADLAETAGTRTVDIEADSNPPETLGEALDALLKTHPALADRVLDADGNLREHVNVLRNGTKVPEGLAAPVHPGDELALFPPVSGG